MNGTYIQRYLHGISPCQAEHHGAGHKVEEVGLVTRTRSYHKPLNDFVCNRNLTEYSNNPIINIFVKANLGACPAYGIVTQLWQARGIFLGVSVASESANWREETRNQTNHVCLVLLSCISFQILYLISWAWLFSVINFLSFYIWVFQILSVISGELPSHRNFTP